MGYLRAGSMPHRVKIQRKVETQGAGPAHEITYVWQDFIAGDSGGGIAARIRPMTGREFMAAQQMQAGVTTQITVRALAVVGVTADMRALNPSTNLAYNIKAVLPDETLQEQVTLVTESGVNAG